MELQSMKSESQEVYNVMNIQERKDHSQGVRSLPLMSADQATNDTMMTIFERSSQAIWFLQVTGGYWSGADGKSAAGFPKFLFILARTFIAVFVVANLYWLVISVVNQEIPSIIGYAANLLGFASVVPAQYLNQCRLQLPAHFQDAAVLNESHKVATNYGLTCAALLMLSLVFLCLSSGPFSTIIILSQLSILSYLTFNMLFLILDLKASSLLIDQLHILADNKVLDMQKFKVVRNDIHRRVEASRWTSDLIVAPCVAAFLLIAVMVFILEQASSIQGLLYLIGILCITAKEILFVMVAFRYVAKVNGRADELTLKLSRDIYCADPEDVKQLLPDIQRVSVYATSLSEPITFPLLFKRVSWQNVIVSAAGFAVTILVSIVKTVVSDVTG